MGRRISTPLPSRDEPNMEATRHSLEERKDEQKKYYDRKASKHVLPSLYPGQQVHVRKEDKSWEPGTVIKTCDEPRSYIIQKEQGTQVRRNRSHLRERIPSSDTSQGKESRPSHFITPVPADIETSVETAAQAPAETHTAQTQGIVKTRLGRIVKKPERYQ